MGGNAFNQHVPDAVFPRMSPATYKSLKAILLPRMEQLYEQVAVPPEAPEKTDHGDLDFVVTQPRTEGTLDRVKDALKAVYSLPQEGRGTSNYAIPADAFDLDMGEGQEGTSSNGLQNTHFQVDVNVCADREDWERTVFLHSYGDTGMILGVIGRGAGLSFGIGGLKLANALPTSPPISLHLSSSLLRILEFYGLSRDRLDAGFTTQREVFEWTATSRLFNARKVAPSEQSHLRGKKRRGPRTMYQNFVEFARERADDPAYEPPHETITQDDVLRFFGKDAEHAALLRASRIKQNAREAFSGRVIEQWIGMRGLPVKWVMDAARERLNERYAREHPGEAILLSVTPWEVALFEMSTEELQKCVVDVKTEMEESGTFELNWQREDARKAEKLNLKTEQ
ncbi:uncharacterized protein C8Q71DRAFT_700317 [Rhodofomes roseus]|uniref:Uncharacterized protein n=1 Tax=Rhodofomes roseus TaxID=34475 RepID=A0ABQ8KSJ8_9APHY|nr:uncharacterized protein C8Q71DRAFT_700317 [Rhodofomes roseus]KAH9841529.1 hypothetical protein C8Q71DRAFT_700317 [Rhodofomes roseus]